MGGKRQRLEEDSGVPIEELFEWNKALAKHPLNISAFKSTIPRAEMIARGLYEEGVLMARIKHQTQVINGQIKGLADPWPSAPKRPAKYAIHVESEASGRFTVTFAACYAAKKFLDAILEDDKFSWRSDSQISLTVDDNEIRITSNELEEIVEYKYTKAENQWELPLPYSGYVRHIRGGRQVEATNNKSAPSVRTKVVRDKPERKPRESREGLVTAIQIAGELKVKPIEVRAALRKMKLTKPAAGWAWTPQEAKEIRKKIEKELKA